jgi:hypothetical protein
MSSGELRLLAALLTSDPATVNQIAQAVPLDLFGNLECDRVWQAWRQQCAQDRPDPAGIVAGLVNQRVIRPDQAPEHTAVLVNALTTGHDPVHVELDRALLAHGRRTAALYGGELVRLSGRQDTGLGAIHRVAARCTALISQTIDAATRLTHIPRKATR